MKKAIFIFLFLPFYLFGQDKGMHFEHGISWEQLQAKAKAEHKYIFIDCFTTWCGPCKSMSQMIFPMEDVGNYFNGQFINIKLQLDSTATDNDDVKNWYQTGHDLAAKYKIHVYPTYLILNENAIAVHRFTGGMSGDMLIEKAKAAMDPDKQYYSLLKKYDAGVRDSAFLFLLTNAAMDAFDIENAKIAFKGYLETQNDFYSFRILRFVQPLTESSKDPGFMITMQYPGKLDSILGKGMANGILQRIIMKEEVTSMLPNNLNKEPDWKMISANLNNKYPSMAREILAKSKTARYLKAKNWKKFQKAVLAYMKEYGANSNEFEKHEYARAIFENCKDKTCLNNALEWSKESFKEYKISDFIDTYANLLYKLGRQKEAIEWEEKAIAAAYDDLKLTYGATLEKMKKGTKTWTE